MKKALVLSLVFALGLGFAVSAQTLSGTWDTTITIDPTGPTIGIDTSLTVDYTIGAWSFVTDITLDETGFVDMGFTVDGVLGAFTLGSTLDFDPVNALFEEWNVVAGVSIAGVTFGADFTLGAGTVLVLSGSGVAGDVVVSVDVTLGDNVDCDFDFAGVLIGVEFPFYCADILAEIEFDCDGFVDLCFTTSGIVVPSFPWLTLDAELCFQTDSKTLTISPDFDFGAGVCFDLYMDLGYTGNGPLTIEDFTIYGIGIEAEFGGVVFTGLTSFDEVNYDLIKDPYWEVYTISTTDDGCCGPFAFDVSVYFLDGGIRLFDIALIEANMSLQVAAQFTFSTGLEIDVEAGNFSLWTIGFEVTW
jgi:hypothetical protein